MTNKKTAAVATDGRITAGLLLATGILLSVAFFRIVGLSDMRRVTSDLEVVVEVRAGEVQDRVNAAIAPVEAMADYIPSQKPMDPVEFYRFAQLARRSSPVVRLAWEPLNGADTNVALESRFDLDDTLPETADPAVAAEARDSGKPVGLPIGSLYRIVWPIYGHALPPAELADRRQALSGMVIGDLPFAEMIRSTLRNTRPVLATIRLYVDHPRGQAFGAPLALIKPGSDGIVDASADPLPELVSGGVRMTRDFPMFGRTWTMVWDFSPELVRSRANYARWICLFAGLLTTLGVVACLLLERHRRRLAESEVAERTRDLSASTAYLQALIDASPVAIGVYNMQSQPVLWNRNTEELTGYSKEEVLGQGLPPALAGALENLAGELEGVIARGEVMHGIELSAHHKNGTPFDVVVSIAGLKGPDGEMQGFITAALDVTEQRKVDAALRATEMLLGAIVSSSDDALISKSLDGAVTTWNQGAERIFGYSAEEMIGQSISVLAVPGEEDDLRKVLDTIRSGERVDHYETRRRRRDGAILDISLCVSPIYDAAGKIVGASKIARDVTEAKAAEKHRQQLSAQLYQAQKMEAIGELTGGMAHDFNNLLSVILGNLDFLSETCEPGSASAGWAEDAITAAETGAELIRRLLAFARRQPLAPKPTNLTSILTGSAKIFGRTLGDDITLQVVVPDQLWPVMIDAAQLESALLNLALNSRHAMPGGGTLTIEARNVSAEDAMADGDAGAAQGDYLVLSVSDTGVGMTPEVQARAFQPFFTTKRQQGSGLGLSMVHGFVEQSGGYTRIYSQVGQGTTVSLYLPRAAMAGKETRSAAAKPVRGMETILVVEDNAPLREVAVRRLRELGYQTLSAGDAEEGLILLKNSPEIDLLFTDIIMPGGMNGRELASHARLLRPDLAVLFTSGFTAAAASAVTREEFGADLLTKPYRQTELARRVRAALDLSLRAKRGRFYTAAE